MIQQTMNDLFRQTKQEWLDEARATARKMLVTRSEVTIEDVLTKCPRPTYIHRNTTGQVFKHSDFVMAGWSKSRRTVSKGRWVMKWTLNADAFPMTMHQIRRSQLQDAAE